MNQKLISQFGLALIISLTFVACEDKDKKSETTTTTDSTANPKKEAVQSTTMDPAMDAIVVAPTHYKLLKDTLGIRVIEVNYKPGDSAALHSHYDYAIYVVQGGKSEFTDKDGKKQVNELPSGAMLVHGAETHAAKNVGKTILKVMLFETNRPSEITPTDESTDASKVAPNLHVVKADSLGIRVIEVNYKPGESSAMHSHPDNTLYVIQGGTMEFTAKDGSKQTRNMTTGMSTVQAGGEHGVKNTGKTTIKAIQVEVSRARAK